MSRWGILLMLVVCGCYQGDRNQETTLGSSTVPGDTLSEIRLDLSLNQIAAGATRARDLKPLVEFSGADLDIGTIADARFIGRKKLAVLDRRSRHVLVLDHETRAVQRIGRPGQGPGEFADPWAMVAVGPNLVVTQPIDPAFIVFDSTGNYLRSIPRPVDGDWRNPMFRAPSLRSDDFQNSPEDVKRRLRADGDSGFLHVLQPNESPMGKDSFDLAAPPAYVMRYRLDLQIKDTVAVMKAPALTRGKVRAGGWQDYEQDLFAPWPLIASGDGWIAFAHGDSAAITVRRVTPARQTVRVTWPFDRPEITEKEKDVANDWLMEDAFRASPDFEKEWKSLPKGRQKQLVEQQKNEYLRFHARAPTITSMYGSGECLFVTGFSAIDNFSGVSRIVVVLNIETGEAEVVRILDADETLRDFSPDRVATTKRDQNGEWHIRIYEHGVSCSVT